MKPVEFVDDALDILRSFPKRVRADLGEQIMAIQLGYSPTNWKPMKTIGAGVNELRVRDASGQYRVIYIAKLKDTVYVLSAFKKKSGRTPKHEIDKAKRRLNALVKARR